MNDMRQLLEVAKADAPPVRVSVDEIVRSGRRRVRRRWAVRGAGAICGVSAVVLAAVSVLPSGGSGEPGPPGTETVGTVAMAPAPPPFSFTFTGYEVGDFEVADPVEVTPGYERAALKRSNVDVGDGPPITLSAGMLTVYRPGVFQPEGYRSGTPVTVAGREGFATTVQRKVLTGGPSLESREHPVPKWFEVPALAWQYADGAWATIESDYLAANTIPAEAQRQLAERFSTRNPAPATAPFRVIHVPDGWKLGSAGPGGLVPGDTSVATVRYVPEATAFGALTGPVEVDAILITVSPVETEGPYPHPFDPPCPAGQHFCDVKIDGRYYAEVQDESGTLSAAQVKAIADGLTFAPVAEKGAWLAVE